MKTNLSEVCSRKQNNEEADHLNFHGSDKLMKWSQDLMKSRSLWGWRQNLMLPVLGNDIS